MLNYPTKAITVKDLNVFNYSLYSAIEMNMLKYNHDSSASIRFLSALIDSSEACSEDIPYMPNFTMHGFEFISIDRINGFYISSIDFDKKNKDRYSIRGYSKYTGGYYILKIVDVFEDFIRHSVPVDAFFSSIVKQYNTTSLFIQPNIKEPVNISVPKSSITITQVLGFSDANRVDHNKPISIMLYGKNTHNEPIKEEVLIEVAMDTYSVCEFSSIEHIMVLNAMASVEIIISPFLTGTNPIWDKILVDRQELDGYPCILTVDKNKKQLVFNNLNPDTTIYPRIYEVFKTVDLELNGSESIIDYYIDVPNRIVYLTTLDNGTKYMKAFMLNIPRTFNNTLDSIKTQHQAIKVEYIEDCQNERFIFWIFPSSKTHDVEVLSIYKDDTLYKDDILLDLIRENIETNRIEIPFSDMGEVALLKFVTSGVHQAIQPVLLDRTKLKPLYIKNLSEIQKFAGDTQEPGYRQPSISSTHIDYDDHGSYAYGDEGYGGTTSSDKVFGFGGVFEKNATSLYKLSSVANVVIDGIKIINVFDTFYFDHTNDMIVTSDTITHIAKYLQGD